MLLALPVNHLREDRTIIKLNYPVFRETRKFPQKHLFPLTIPGFIVNLIVTIGYDKYIDIGQYLDINGEVLVPSEINNLR